MGNPIRVVLCLLIAALLPLCAFAQQAEVTYSDNFQSYGSPRNVPGWVDTSIGNPKPVADGLFKTWPDPLQGAKATNIAYGSKSASGKPEGNNPRIGHFSTLSTRNFSASGRFEYRGRFLRTDADARIGLTFLSAYPEKDQYYMVGLWTVPGTAKLTMQLFGFGAGTITGKTDSDFTPAPNKWYRFLVQVDDTAGVTKMRARFWEEGTTEPTTFTIDAEDAAATRLKTGRIGFWGAVRGAIYLDDIAAKSPVDHTAPVITFYEDGVLLPANATTPISHDARVDVRATDDLSGVATLTATADGQPYTPLTPITVEGPHVIAARAVDQVGNASTSQTTVLVDKTAPVITLTVAGTPLPLPISRFKSVPAIVIAATDQWTGATVTATLDGKPYTSGTPIDVQGTHHLVVEAVDGVKNKRIVQATILVDLGAPVIEFYEKGVKLSSPAKFKVDPTIELRLTDEHSNATYTARLENGAEWKSLQAMPLGWHKITVDATDEAGNTSTATLDVLVDKDAPVVVLSEGGTTLDVTKTAKYKQDVAIGVSITDATSKIAASSTLLNSQPYTSGTLITVERNTHVITVRAEDEAGNTTDVTLAVLLDKSAPLISFSESALKLDVRELQKFVRDATIVIDVDDVISSATYTAKLTTPARSTSAPFVSGTAVTVEDTHEILVSAIDEAGNTAESTLRILVDKTPPSIAFAEQGTPLDTTKETPFARDVNVDITVTDNLPGVTYTAKLDGADYTSGAPITADGPHVVSVKATDAAGNTRDGEVKVLVDKTGPAIAFLEGGVELDTAARKDFNRIPTIVIQVTDVHSTVTYVAKNGEAPFTSGSQVVEGYHTITVVATDARGNESRAKLDLLVDPTPPVVKLRDKKTGNELPASGGIFAYDLTVEAVIQDTSETKTVATLNDGPFSLSMPIAEEREHKLSVAVTDELQWKTTVGSTFIVDKTAPKISVFEGQTPLLNGASFARDITINATAEDITPAQLTATIDGAPYTLGSTYSTEGTHKLVVNGVDAAGNRSEPVSLTFHVDKNAPEVTLLETGNPFPDKKTFTRDVVATVNVKAATETTRVATIDGQPYTLGDPYPTEGHHHIKVVVTNLANLSTTVEADFTIDKTPPTLTLYAKQDVPFVDGMKFAADLTPLTVADDNLTKPPKVVVLLNGQELAPGAVITEEKFHTISATATDDGGLEAKVGPFGFVLDKTPPDVDVTVDGKPLEDGAKFNKAITPLIEAEDLTTPVYTLTLNGKPYERGTIIEADDKYTLLVSVKDDLGNERALDPIHFTVDKTAPVVRIDDKLTNEPFTGGLFKRPVTPVVQITDLTETTTIGTLVNRTTKEESPWTSGQEISSDGHYTLKVTVTDELEWVTVVPPIDFTIDQAAPQIVVTENGTPLVTDTIFNRDARPKIDVTDTTTPTVVATLNGETYTSETLVTVERKHTLNVKATDELGFVTEIQPIEFTVDKTAPVVTLTENGVAFVDGALLNHDARPLVTVQDLTAYTIVARVDGQPYTLGTPVTAEGPHTFDVVVTDAAGWETKPATVNFVIDKTAPVVTVHVGDNGPVLESGAEFKVTISPFIKVQDLSATTITAKLNGQPFTSNTPVEAEGEYVLEVSVTDAANWTTTLAPIAFIVDKTPPDVTVTESGVKFESGTKLNRAAVVDITITDLTKTTTVATLNGEPFTFPATVSKDGKHTLNVTVTDNLEQATPVPAIAFTVDQTPPVVRILENGVLLESGSAFNRDVTPQIEIEDLTTTTVKALLNGQPYTFGTPISEEGQYTLTAEVTDELEWVTAVPAIIFFVDKTPPVVKLMEGDEELTDGRWFNRDVTPRAVIVDTTTTTTTATLNGQPYTMETPVKEEGTYTLAVTVTDKVGLKTEVPPVSFTIDKTPPALTFTYPAANATLATPQVVVIGGSDDAVSVQVNGVETTIDATAKTFTTVDALELLEGENTLTAFGVDRAGNQATISETVSLDTRAPELTITAPAPNACINGTEVTVTGRAPDASLATVKISAGGDPVVATLSADRRTFTATLPLPSEGKFVIRAEATDASGHVSLATVPVTVDRTKPTIEISESGSPFTATLVNRVLALYVRAKDADSSAKLDVKLDGQPYVNGTTLTADKTYELRATATDCASNKSDELVVRFTIDRTPPQIVSIAPQNGATVNTKPAIQGSLSEPASLVAEGTPHSASVNGLSFSLAPVLGEGVNNFSLLAADLAGNQSRTPYSIDVDTLPPSVTITESGNPIAANAVYARDVVPVIVTDDVNATVTATINNAPFTSGTTVTADGSYTIVARAKDARGNESAAVTATFRIDRSGPVVSITSPGDGTSTGNAAVEVRGTFAAATGVTVNGVTASLSGGNFAATVPLDLGPNTLVATAADASGRSTTDSVDVVRTPGAINILLTAPVDKMLTNRPTTVVAGQVLNVENAQKVTLNGTEVAIDPAGAFRRLDFPLTEGENVITAAVTSKSGVVSSVSITVTADFTPPVLTVRGNGLAMAEGARYATSPSITLEATDNQPTGLTRKLTVDGEVTNEGVTTLADGGHALTAVARDAAGNETRVDRAFFVGNAGTLSGCGLGNFEPASDSSVFSETVRITGRSGGSANVLINGKAAAVADGSFCGDATLVPGRNEVTIQCADANGQPTSDPASTLILYRYVDPTVTITSPSRDAVLTAKTVTVTGTVGAGVKSGEVNGVEFTVPDDGAPSHTFSVPNVPLTSGLNVLIARARTTSARAAAASTHVRVLNETPQLVLTSPLTGSETGTQTVDVGGTYAHVDPSTIVVAVGSATYPATVNALTDTTGTFRVAAVTIAPSAQSTITVTGRNAANVQATASAQVRHVPTAPFVSITSPADNVYLPSTQSGLLRVSGTVSTEGGTLVQVNGVAATVSEGTFTADVELGTSSNGITPIIARATTPDSRQAADAIRVIRFSAPLAMRESFPANDANGVDAGAAIVALFNNPIDGDTARSAMRVVDSRGTQMSGAVFIDRDAITFAPAQPLTNGERYTVTIATSLRDAAGAPLAAAQSFSFNVSSTAPATAPIVDDTITTGCFSSATITGRVSTPGARVRLEVDGVAMSTVASDTAAFKFTFTFSGQAGYHLVRVREIGADGTLSAERALCYRISCAIPQVLNATLDRTAKTVAIQFSKAMDPQTLTASANGSILLVPQDETALTGTVSMNAAGDVATVSLASVPNKNIALTVKKSAKDTTGTPMSADYTQTFAFSDDPNLGRGDGYVNGAVYDATNGRPLEGAVVEIAGVTTKTTNARGRYTHPMKEGAYTIQASAPGYTTVWRQVVVPAGAGVVPIDIRLTKRGEAKTANGAAQTLAHGADTKITKKTELQLAAASVATGKKVRVTAVGGQSLAGLLPLGWSPLAAAEITIDDSPAVAPLPAAKLTFHVDRDAVTNASQTLALAQYDSERDEWRTVVAAATVATDGKVTFDVTSSGNYALVYADKAPLSTPPPARTGIALSAAANPCSSSPEVCKLTGRSFTLDPKAVLPSGRSVATLTTDGTKPYPSGTAVQAFIDEQLNLADGRVLYDPPFATDLLIYRTLAGDAGVADFHLAPSAQAVGVILRDGVDHIRVVDYPGRVDRGTLIGNEGGRVPGDDVVAIDVPVGATTEPLHASVSSISENELASYGTIAGFRVAAGFSLTLTRANETTTLPDGLTAAPPALVIPGRATLSIPTAALPSANAQVVIAEVVPSTPYGTIVRLVALTSPVTSLDIPGVKVFATRPIVSTELPLEGITRDAHYLVLAAENPMAFAFGQVRLATGAVTANARVTAGVGNPQGSAHGVRDLTRVDGVFVVPVAAKPAAPFSLVPRTLSMGDGATYVHGSSPDAGAFINVGALELVSQPPQLKSVTPADGAVLDGNASFVVQATFDVPLDGASVANTIRVTNLSRNRVLAGTVALAGATAIRFTTTEVLDAGSRYSITILPSIRGVNGAPFGRTQVTHFTTRAIPTNVTVNRDLIRITLPNEQGHSVISGQPGALPAGAMAVAVRSGRYFIESYAVTAASNGSFTMTVGNRHAKDRITLTDIIELQVLDSVSRAIIATLRLTPFVSEDGRTFYVSNEVDSTLISPEGIRVSIAAGTFDEMTAVTLGGQTKEPFAKVPKLDQELNFVTAIDIKFDGMAKKPLEIEIPIPANTQTAGRQFLLGRLGDSVRGPRIEIDDTIFIKTTPQGSFFTTVEQSGGNTLRIGTQAVGTQAVYTGQKVKDWLLRMVSPASYAVIDIRTATPSSVGWAAMDSLQANQDIFWELWNSIYVSNLYLTAKRGRVVAPVLANTPFYVEGVDTATGMTNFRSRYDGVPPAENGEIVALPSAQPNATGPFPVFARPFRIEQIELAVANEDLKGVPGFKVRLGDDDIATITRTGESPKSFHVVNIDENTPATGSGSVRTVQSKVGQRLFITSSADDIEPVREMEIVFNEAIRVPDDDVANLKNFFRLQKKRDTSTGETWESLEKMLEFSIDSGNRRVTMKFAGELQRGATYRVVIAKTLADTNEETNKTLVGNNDLYLPFTIRSPHGDMFETPMTLAKGVVRDIALDGNLLFVSSLEAGLVAYDVSDPSVMLTKPPVGHTEPFPYMYADDTPPMFPGAQWSVFVDRHGRIWTTAVNSMFGVVRSFRSENFVDAAQAGGNPKVEPKASSIVSWRPGVNVGMPLGTTWSTYSDRAEATPRKIQVLSQDQEIVAIGAQDFDETFSTPNELMATATATGNAGALNEFRVYTVTVPKSPGYVYRLQRVTVENRTLNLRWSADIRIYAGESSATIRNVLVRAGDRIHVVRNYATYGAVSLFGYGVGLYDLNAMESNHLHGDLPPADYKQKAEQIVLTEGKGSPCLDPNGPDGNPCLPQKLTFTPDAAVVSGLDADNQPIFNILALESTKGVLSVVTQPEPGAREAFFDNTATANEGVAFTSKYINQNGAGLIDHPRLATIRKAFKDAGRSLTARFGTISRYDHYYDCINPETGQPETCISRYALISGYQFGILVIDIDESSLTQDSLVDIIWVPSGAVAVRAIAGTHYATALDAKGRTLLIDLSRIDEKDTVDPLSPCAPGCTQPLFKTVQAAIATGPVPGDSTSFGSDDPRIVWKSRTRSGMIGTLAPVADPETGFVFHGNLMEDKVHIMSGLDPRVAVRTNLGHDTLSNVTSLVPLGVQPPLAFEQRRESLPECADSGPDTTQPTRCRDNVSMGVFRVEIALPGSIDDTVEPAIAIDSERIPGVATEQTVDPLPRAHLRRFTPEGTTSTRPVTPAAFRLERLIGDSVPGADRLRFQKGYNRYVSKWIVAMADPRASEAYTFTAGTGATNLEEAGCFHCKLPKFLRGKTRDLEYFELYTAGRSIAIRPELTGPGSSVFAGTKYDYLGDDKKRMVTRIGTIMADTVRPANVLTAAQNPPLATGVLQGTVFLHSGELAASAVDLDAGGRAGWNVIFDRSYRSRTIGGTAFGAGWDSSIFKRLRVLPTGDVEYRDGTGEIWLFVKNGTKFESPRGYFLLLVRTTDGWTLVDQKRRVMYFDEYGRVVREGDEFYTTDGKGNQIRYLYDEKGRLAKVIDPVERPSTITYHESGTHEGLVDEIEDWRDNSRTVRYVHQNGLLTQVDLPSFTGASGTATTPKMKYEYTASAGSYSDKLELRANLEKITYPNEFASNTPRVTYTYGGTAPRDYVSREKWATNEFAEFQYTEGANPTAKTKDVLGQEREYTFKMPQLPPPPAGTTETPQHLRYSVDRAHVKSMKELNVETADVPFGELPASVSASGIPVSGQTREFTYDYNEEGQTKTATLEGVSTTGYAYENVGGLAGTVVRCTATGPAGGNPCEAGATLGSPSTNSAAVNDIVRYDFVHNGGFMQSVSANGKTISTPEAHRSTELLTAANDAFTSDTTYDLDTGLPKLIKTSGGSSQQSNAGSQVEIKYPAAQPVERFKRGLPTEVLSGETDKMKTQMIYESEDVEVVIDQDGVRTKTKYDAWRRPVAVRVEKPGDPLVLEELYDYYPAGQVKEHRRRQDGAAGSFVRTTYAYDAIGRLTSTTVDNVKIGGNDNATKTTTTDYSQYGMSRVIVATSPTGSATRSTLDTLGRTKATLTTADAGNAAANVKRLIAYDKAGNAVYASDTLGSAVTTAYDVNGRARKTLSSQGVITETDYDGWGNVTSVRHRRTPGGDPFYTRASQYTADGKLIYTTETGEGGATRTTRTVWDGAGRDVGTSVTASGGPGRVSLSKIDSAGRVQETKFGEGNVDNVTATIETAKFAGYGEGSRAPSVTTSEALSSHEYNSTRNFDTVGHAKSVSVGSLNWTQEQDQAGNTVRSSLPGRAASTRTFDAAGNVKAETLPDGASQSFEYDASGATSKFVDPASEDTKVTPDLLGRPRVITYKDGTTQEVVYEGSRVRAIKDRQNRWQSFEYNTRGQLVAIWAGATPGAGEKLDQLEYTDGTGRLTAWTNKDSRLEYEQFDLDDNARITRQIRYVNGTGFTEQTVLDEFEQTHTWNGYGERTGVNMPGDPQDQWTKQLTMEYDAAGNLTRLLRDGVELISGRYHNAGRPQSRTVTLRPSDCTNPTCEKKLERTYGYDAETGQLRVMSAKIAGVEVAGSRVAYGDSLQVTESRLLGVSGNARSTRYSYDQRSRLFGSVTAAEGATVPPPPPSPGGGAPASTAGAGVAQEVLSPADFRAGQARTGALDPTVRSLLQSRGIDPNKIDPPGNSATERPGHKVDTFTRGSTSKTFNYDGAVRKADDRYVYTYDEKERLIWVAEKPLTAVVPVRRIVYTYDGNNRLIGRTAQKATPPSVSDPQADWPWDLETRRDILEADGLPAETTFVWDPITDRLVSVFRTGSSRIVGDANRDLLKQVIHGDMAYDDPIEVLSIDKTQIVPNGSPARLARLYPVYDEAAGGTLQAVINRNGEVVARSLTTDPFGGEQFELAGAAIDRVEIEATKDDAGNLVSVVVSMRATEQLASSTVADGARLAAVTSSGAVVRTATAAPELAPNDPYTIRWNLTASEWSTLVDSNGSPVSLSVAATSSLRAAVWAVDVPVLAAPEWATASSTSVFASGALPVEIREPLSALTGFISAIPEGGNSKTTPWEVEGLALLGANGTGNDTELLMAATFQAQPFAEPMTRLSYVRARWYDPVTGTWLSPDPLGYIDSSNLYAFAGGDPVNRRDPTGAAAGEAALAAGLLKGGAAVGGAAVAATAGTVAVVAASAATTGTALYLTWELIKDVALTREAEENLREVQRLNADRLARRPLPRPAPVPVPTPQPTATSKKKPTPAPTPKPAPPGNEPFPPLPQRDTDDDCEATRRRLTIRMQALVDRAVAELKANPQIARTLMTTGSYLHLVKRDGLYRATFGKAVERLVRNYVAADLELSPIIVWTGITRDEETGQFSSSPDFTSRICQPLVFDVTTVTSLGAHQRRPGGSGVVYLLYVMPEGITFR